MALCEGWTSTAGSTCATQLSAQHVACMMWHGRSLRSMPGSLSTVWGPGSLTCMQRTGSSACCAEAGKFQLCAEGMCCRDAASDLCKQREASDLCGGPALQGRCLGSVQRPGRQARGRPVAACMWLPGSGRAAEASLSCQRCCQIGQQRQHPVEVRGHDTFTPAAVMQDGCLIGLNAAMQNKGMAH